MFPPESMPRLPSLLRLKALLVDFDGTLVDSLDSLKKAYHAFLRHFSCEGTAEEFEALNGPSLPEVVAFLKQKYQLDGSKEELQGLYEQGLIKAYRQAIHLLPGAKEALEFAKQNCGLKLALVTSAEREIVDASLQGLKLPFDFDAISCMQSGVRSKPAPDLYANALQLLQVQAGDALAVEDSFNGVLAATSAGVFAIQFVQDGTKADREIGGLAVELHGGWHSLLAILQNAYPDDLQGFNS